MVILVCMILKAQKYIQLLYVKKIKDFS